MVRVLLTGGSGFVAAHVLDVLLKRGHSVVTTVRSQAKADLLKSLHPDVGKDRLDFAFVEDIAMEDAFDEAVKSDPPFEAVIHTASPYHFRAKDIQKELLDPAVIGTTGILKSIKKSAPTVKRVVITTSFAAMVDSSKGYWPEHTYSDDDWNPTTHEEALKNAAAGYRASKTFAEKAAWDFLEKEKPGFTITTLAPPLVLGPIIPSLQSLETVNTSNERTRDLLQGKMKEKYSPTGSYIFADVRDLSILHVLSIEKEEAANQRFFVCNGPFSNKELADMIRAKFPEYADKLPGDGIPGGDYPAGGIYKTDASKAEKVFGIKWTTFEQSTVDAVNALKAAGA
ncbi:NAD(P)-binding protein [Lipomyces tetrasporus]|uniref:NAD(P)-binding protein n=1 Tax=Lipomyces tetrasporus TaxID=54092 RepID=A0AAD7QUK7_9ASCO|nr:NAD(P)-binding protein [Lipomyces tetrasporus]KAJ8101788.1 NAD(P)-binding protein [Lipomyces tetrasporus]